MREVRAGLGSRIVGLVRLFRFELPLAAGVCVVMGELLALGRFAPPGETLWGFLSVFFISATSLILNDYFDLETDRINAPERPLPAGLVRAREVLWLAGVVTALGLITASLISLAALAVASVVWMVGFLYNWRYKKTGLPGNLMVCFSVGMTFIYGGIAAGRPFEVIVWLFALMVMLIDLGEEIAADAMDLEGDRAAGSHSLAVIFGREKALRISAAVFLLVILVSGLPFALDGLAWVYALPLALMDVVIVYSTGKLLDARIVNRRIYVRAIYLSGLAALLIFIIIRLAG